MAGGATMVRFVSNVLQESRITVSAAVPPIAHNSFSRLPRSHRVNLKCLTCREYWQDGKILATHFFGKTDFVLFAPFAASATFSALQINGTIFARRFSRQFFENAVELGKRLEAYGERDFADPKIDIFQKFTRRLESNPRNVIDELSSGDLFKFFAQVGGIDSDRFGDFAERKVLG